MQHMCCSPLYLTKSYGISDAMSRQWKYRRVEENYKKLQSDFDFSSDTSNSSEIQFEENDVYAKSEKPPNNNSASGSDCLSQTIHFK